MHNKPIFTIDNDSAAKPNITLHSPITLKNASSFLWNKSMMMHVNCRSYVVSQFMQPEPTKYSFAPNMEAKTFMQPEHHYYAGHPGRFFYLKDNETNKVVSLPFAPMNQPIDHFSFTATKHEIIWTITHFGVEVEIKLTLDKEAVIELWSIKLSNTSQQAKSVTIYPYFSIGYMSWMNQSADFDPDLDAIIASFVTPYQKVEDYYKNTNLK